jgi:hypothetical protein
VKGQTSFVVDESFWGLANTSTGADLSRFFIGFRNVDKQVSDMDLKVETLSRALWSVAVLEE